MLQEIWKVLPSGCGCYSVSTFGRVRRETSITAAKAGHILKQHLSRDGYRQVGISVAGKPRLIRVHRAVYEAFFGKIPENLVINHKDGDKQNNYPWNLEAITNRENIIHAFRILKRDPTGQKVTAAQVVEIRDKLAQGVTMSSLSRIYNVSVPAIANIAYGKTWKNVGGPISTPRRMTQSQHDVAQRISDEQATAFVQRYHNGESAEHLAKEAGVHIRSMYNWIEGRSRALPNSVADYIKNTTRQRPSTIRVPPKGKLAHPSTKLAEQQVLALRQDRANGMSVAGVARKYKMSWSQVSAIAAGESWVDVGGPRTPHPQSVNLAARIVAKIGQRGYDDFVIGHKPAKDIAREFGVTPKTAYCWRRQLHDR